MADKELVDLGTPIPSASLDGDVTFYAVDENGNSRPVKLSDIKVWVNTDPTAVPASEPLVGAKVQLSAGFNVSSTSEQIVSWGAEDFDTDAFWSGGAPTRFTVPSGVTKVRLAAGIRSTGAGAVNLNISIRKNGSDYVASLGMDIGFANGNLVISTGILPVTAGDYFELTYVQGTSTTRAIVDDGRTFFSIEAAEHTI